MATRGPTQDGESPVTLPDVVPFELSPLSHLSWELGSRVVADAESSKLGDWERTAGRWTLSVFRVTSATVVLRVRTPVGRSRFYGATLSDLESVRPALESSTEWRRA